MDQLIFTDEAAIAGAPVPFLTINTVGADDHALRHPGAEGVLPAQDRGRRAALLHRLLRARGRHRPRRAAHQRRRDGDDYVINGQKMWTSLIQYADYVWLACRTDPEAKKHKGISMLIVPTDRRRLLVDAGAHDGGSGHQRHLLPGRPGAGVRAGRRRERRLAADHQPAQPRARRAHLGRRRSSPRCARCASGRRTPSCRTGAASSTRSGCRSTWPGCTPRPSSSS